MKRVPLLLKMLAISAMLSAVLLNPAPAATIYTLTSGNVGLSGYPGPYGTVSVSLLDSNTAQFTFTANSGFLFGGAQAADVNLVGGTGTNFSTGLSTLAFGGSAQVDGWGVFNSTTDNFDGFGDAVSSIIFTLDKASGTWADDAHVLTANADGHSVAAHIFVIDSTGLAAATTGFATDGPPHVPEASALVLFSSGLVGLVVWRRKKRFQ